MLIQIWSRSFAKSLDFRYKSPTSVSRRRWSWGVWPAFHRLGDLDVCLMTHYHMPVAIFLSTVWVSNCRWTEKHHTQEATTKHWHRDARIESNGWLYYIQIFAWREICIHTISTLNQIAPRAVSVLRHVVTCECVHSELARYQQPKRKGVTMVSTNHNQISFWKQAHEVENVHTLCCSSVPTT